MVEPTYNFVCKPWVIEAGTWLLIESCGAHRFSVGAFISGLISVIVTLSGVLQLITITDTTQEISIITQSQGILCMITAIITIVFLFL